nr:hypothetical protein [Treponema sp.]
EKYKDNIIDKVKQKRSELENYKAHGFDNQIKSMYEMIIGMINNSRSFHRIEFGSSLFFDKNLSLLSTFLSSDVTP